MMRRTRLARGFRLALALLAWRLMYQGMHMDEAAAASRYYGVDSISVTEADA